MLILGSFRFTRQKILIGQRRAHAVWAPDVRGLENHVFAHFGVEKFRNLKKFFLQISFFVGPIYGINNIFSQKHHIGSIRIFSSGLEITLTPDPNFEMAAVPRWLGPGPKFFHQMNHHIG